MIKEKAADYNNLLYIDPANSDQKVDVTTCTDADLLNLVLLGNNSKTKELERSKGHVTSWAIAHQCANDQSMYYAIEPDDDALKAGVDCNTSDYSEDLIPPEADF